MDYPLPVIGFSAFSGTGKTTLLKRVLPLLQVQGFRLGVIKHAHHNFDIDHPGKDSYELRHAGADKMLITSRRRMAVVEEFRERTSEPTLEQALDSLQPDDLDIILVEGFKAAHFPKIEIHRPELGKPVMFPNDKDIIAIASTATASELGIEADTPSPTYLKLNEPGDIVDFIIAFIKDSSRPVLRKQHA
ncbi:MAG: molybdopterin-guanine dinucleotide biosynthesis protein B [Gammaproteobacteria bacterium]|nr:MAG: molybdopterin-guanine dinucleotide biosynthesis protein B [Gammaproteobacteria bacterium]